MKSHFSFLVCMTVYIYSYCFWGFLPWCLSVLSNVDVLPLSIFFEKLKKGSTNQNCFQFRWRIISAEICFCAVLILEFLLHSVSNKYTNLEIQPYLKETILIQLHFSNVLSSIFFFSNPNNIHYLAVVVCNAFEGHLILSGNWQYIITIVIYSVQWKCSIKIINIKQ